MLCLWHALAVRAARGQVIALDERDALVMVRERPRRPEPCHAAPKDNGVSSHPRHFPTSDGCTLGNARRMTG